MLFIRVIFVKQNQQVKRRYIHIDKVTQTCPHVTSTNILIDPYGSNTDLTSPCTGWLGALASHHTTRGWEGGGAIWRT